MTFAILSLSTYYFHTKCREFNLPEHLLIIEDSQSIAKVIERIGLSLGYKVTKATTFAQVKKLLANKNDYFVATIDYGLPDAREGEVIPFVLEHDIPSIVMTGRMDNNTRKKILNLPVIDYITKENAQAYHYLLRVLNGQLTNRRIGVLVVDDSLTARNHVAQLLQRRNFSVFKASDGTKALNMLNTHPEIKMVITDHEMPGMDGIELIQTIRKDHAKTELIIIGISGANKHFQSARFIKNGADDFLKKPFCPEEFYCRIMQNIEKLQYIEEIEMAANKDYLTSLFNRRYFLKQAEIIHKALAESSQAYVLVIIVVDEFKKINENIGHEMGDKVLLELSKLFSHHFKDQLIARFGGAEFGGLLHDEDEEIIEERLKQFSIAVSEYTVTAKKESHNFSVSIGGTIVNHELTIKALLREADGALHQAVDNGGNNTVMNGFIELL